MANVTGSMEDLLAEIVSLKEQISELTEFVHRDATKREDRDRDLLALALGASVSADAGISIATKHPVAYDSQDHRFPRGTVNDNTRHPRFVRACERILGPKLRHLDLGCAGGGLVWDFLIRGHLSVGVEGSDYSQVWQRAEWRTIPSHLFTADITKPFRLSRRAAALSFDVITAWEVLEHIPEKSLAGFFKNVAAHLDDAGLFVCSIATFKDENPQLGATWHVTVKPAAWWIERFEANGFLLCESPFEHADYVRGSGNPRALDWDGSNEPHRGFHLVARKGTRHSAKPAKRRAPN